MGKGPVDRLDAQDWWAERCGLHLRRQVRQVVQLSLTPYCRVSHRACELSGLQVYNEMLTRAQMPDAEGHQSCVALGP